MPDGPFDTIVCAEILYYWSADAGRDGLRRIEAALAPGGTLLAVHWRHPDPRRELTGDDVHAIIDAETRLAARRRATRRPTTCSTAGWRAGERGERIVIVGGGPAAQAAAARLPRGGRRAAR